MKITNTKRSYVYDRFDVMQGKRTREQVAADYLNEVLNGRLVILVPSTIWGKEFVKLCKKCTTKAIYRNFSRDNELRGEYSIHPTKAWDEVKVNNIKIK
jgi:hypothetical protein